jgi:hypothetical protein
MTLISLWAVKASLQGDLFINERARLRIVECKLWKNPQARREVVAHALDYVFAVTDLSYADLQREVSAAVGKQGKLPDKSVCRRPYAPYLRR